MIPGELHRAALSGDLAHLRLLLADGGNVNERFSTSIPQGPYFCFLTPLMEAARNVTHGVETSRFLIERGADPHLASEGGATVLHYAAFAGNAPALAYYLTLGLDVNKGAVSSMTPLMAACHGGLSTTDLRPNPECARMILTAGAEPHRRGPIRQTALHVAAGFGSGQCAEMLLAAGCELEARDAHGKTPLMYAKSADVARVLLAAGADPNAVEDLDAYHEFRRTRALGRGAEASSLARISESHRPETALGLVARLQGDGLLASSNMGSTPMRHWLAESRFWRLRCPRATQ